MSDEATASTGDASTAATAPTEPVSASGYYQVKLARKWPHEGFTYRPAATSILVDADLLALMRADGVVLSVDPA